VHDKVVRRRRAVLALLVIVAIVLLTDYFGESSSSPLHSVQRGIVATLSPVQDGASKVLSPFRDIPDWFSSTLNAKSQRDQYKRDYEQAERQLAVAQAKNEQAGPAARELALDQQLGINAYDPVSADVIGRNQSLWYQQVSVNAGSGAGVHVDDPVVADGALVGRVQLVSGSSAEITLITNHTVNVAATVQTGPGASGVLEPDVGNPNSLLLTELPNHANISPGQLVVTAGFADPSDPSQSGSLYPPAIPIGKVAAFSPNSLLNNGEVPVTPLASIRRFTSVQILTKPYGDAKAADAAGSSTTGGNS
jgi:rod shape-determining protein MreC